MDFCVRAVRFILSNTRFSVSLGDFWGYANATLRGTSVRKTRVRKTGVINSRSLNATTLLGTQLTQRLRIRFQGDGLSVVENTDAICFRRSWANTLAPFSDTKSASAVSDGTPSQSFPYVHISLPPRSADTHAVPFAFRVWTHMTVTLWPRQGAKMTCGGNHLDKLRRVHMRSSQAAHASRFLVGRGRLLIISSA